MDFTARLWQEIGTSAPHLAGVLISAVVLYLTFTVILRLWGQRLYANRSGTGLAVVLVLGAIVGRSMLGPNATLLGGLTCLATLVLLESIFGTGRRVGLLSHRRAVLVYDHGHLDRRAMRRYHLHEHVMWARLRQSGVGSLDEVQGIVLEADGSLSILRSDTPLHPEMLTNVRNGARLLDRAEPDRPKGTGPGSDG